MKSRFAALPAGLALLLGSGAVQAGPRAHRDEAVYIGTQGSGPGQGIFAARFDPRDGKLTPTGLAAEVVRPTWLLAHPRLPVLYAVSDPGADSTAPPRIVAYRSEGANGALRELAAVPSGRRGPTHLALDRAATTLFVANYASATAAALPLAVDGRPGEPTSTQNDYGTGPNRRQAAPHSHAVSLNAAGRILLVADFGADRLFVYGFNPKTRSLTPAVTPFAPLPAGSGPRHIAVHPGGRFVYLITELRPAIKVLRWSARRDQLEPVETVTTMTDDPEDRNKGAEIAVSPNGRFLYSSNRGEDVILVHSIDRRTGRLREIQRTASGGQLPWSFTFHRSGRWMLVTNQASGSVDVFRVNPQSGLLSATSNRINVGKATSVTFVTNPAR